MTRWRARGDGARPPAALAEALQISPAFLNVLWRRGYRDEKSLEAYLSPRPGSLTNPSKWPQIPRAAKILADALIAGKKLVVWGDYDADGVTAAALTLDILAAHDIEAAYHLPHRLKEGYGLNLAELEKLAARGYQVLLTVDCGISDAKIIEKAERLGMTVVVSDHHLPPPALPPATAIVNPRMEGDWPCPDLAGVGVAFYLMAAVNALLAPVTGKRYKMDDVLDLVALGTIADMMPLTGENRILAKAGMEKIRKGLRPGIAALKRTAGMTASARLNQEQIAFGLAPRINAVGRMSDPAEALELLRERDYLNAQKRAEAIARYNEERKTEEKRAFGEALKQASELLEKKRYEALALLGEDWAPGIAGIVAARVSETFGMPAAVLCPDGDNLKGSARAWGNFDLYRGLADVADLLLGFGGHKKAAGLRLRPENLDAFRRAFSDSAKRQNAGEEFTPEILTDGELNFKTACDPIFLRELELMEPFGEGNEEPVFVSPPVVITSRRPLGHTGEHVKLRLKDVAVGCEYEAKAWRLANAFPASLINIPIRVAYSPRLDEYRGMPTIDLGVKDWHKI